MEKKLILIIALMAACGLLPIAMAQSNDAQLLKEAKVTKANAEKTALTKAPNGKVKSAEIEREKGHLVWSFDIAKPKTREIIEVLVDAKTGAIISTQIESPADQAREAAADRNQRR